jgi:hypothetical protein
MSYSYEKEKPYIFTEEGQRDFLKVRDHANKLARIAGAFTVEHAMEAISGDSWAMLACVDRLVELKEFRYVYTDTATQFHVLVKCGA